MDYQYDIFISYPRKPSYVGDWVCGNFFNTFNDSLDNLIGGEPRIFLDKSSITNGQEWQTRILDGLNYSKCMIAIISQRYLTSENCCRELAVFLNRLSYLKQKQLIDANHPGIFFPILVGDIYKMPTELNNIQFENFSNYVHTAHDYINTIQYVNFEKEIRAWSKIILNAILSSPDCDPDWNCQDLTQEPISHIIQQPLNKISIPRLS